MTRIQDILYFAPGIRFADLNLQSPGLPRHYRRRMVGLYIEPAEECTARGHAFAGGVLLVTCIDALARVRYGDNEVGRRFKRFARDELQSFATAGLDERFYDSFRNGLVHEGRLKDGAQFSLDVVGQTVEERDGLLLINPELLAGEVRAALDAHVALLDHDASERQRLAQALIRDHQQDFAAGRAEP